MLLWCLRRDSQTTTRIDEGRCGEGRERKREEGRKEDREVTPAEGERKGEGAFVTGCGMYVVNRLERFIHAVVLRSSHSKNVSAQKQP